MFQDVKPRATLLKRLRRLVPEPSRPARDAGLGLGPRGVLLMAAWLGLASGLAELGVLLAQDAFDPKVTVESIRTNRHYLWMVPASGAAILGAAGLGLALLARVRPALAWRSAPFVLVAGACLGPLLTVRGLHPAASALVALGVASRAVPPLRARRDRARRWALATLPALGVLACLPVAVDVRRSRTPGGSGAGTGASAVARPGSPSVLLIVMDTVRADHLSLHGYGRDTTPNLARWARRGGVRFDRARSTAPWTLPSHASMFTGHWPHRLSADVDSPLDGAEPTLAEFLRDRGYATGGFVANTYYCNAWYGLDRGFDRYEDFPENEAISPLEVLRSSAVGRRLVEVAGVETATPGDRRSRKPASRINRDYLAWLDRQGGRPTFGFLNYYDAHGPYEPPEGHGRRFGPAAADRAYRLTTVEQAQAFKKKRAAGGAAAEADREANQLLVDSYDDCIAQLDGQIGRLLDDLDRRGALANTLVIVTSDHGEHFGDRGLFGHGHSLYRSLIDVPLLVLPPSTAGAPATPVVREPVSLRDLPATVVDVLGLGDRSPFPGRSLARRWAGGPAGPPDGGDPPLSVVEHQKKFAPSPHIPASIGPLGAVVAEEKVYIRAADGREELYDLEADPAEIHDLAATPEARPALPRFRALLRQLVRDGDPARTPATP